MSKPRLDIYINDNNLFKCLEFQLKRGLKSKSQAIDRILTEFFRMGDIQTDVTDRLNKVIQNKENEIRNLKYEMNENKRMEDKE